MSTTPETPADGRITTERLDRIFAIGIDRPRKLNGFSPQMLVELAQAYTALERDEEAWVGLLYAHGDNFTAGLELDKVAPVMRERGTVFPVGAVDPLALRPPVRTKPLVCAVQGICFTLGIELMLAADIVVAADDCRFSQLEVQRGIMATGGATLRMAERAGLGNALLHLLTGDEFGSAEALRLNFVQKVVPKGQQLEEAIRIAERVAAQAPLAVVATRLNALKAVERGPLEAMAEFVSVQQRLSRTEDAAEGLKSFVEKRPSRFSGR